MCVCFMHIILYIDIKVCIHTWFSVPTPLPPGRGHGSAIVLSPSPPCGVVGVWYCPPPPVVWWGCGTM